MARRGGGCYDPCELTPASILRRCSLLLLLLALPGCGVSFRSNFTGTEIFKSVSLSGERVVGSELTLNLVVTQPYPVPVQIACYAENQDNLTDDQKSVIFHERAPLVGQVVLEPRVGGDPQDKNVEKRELSFKFTPSDAGEWFVACLTPGAAENGYGMAFKVRGAG